MANTKKHDNKNTISLVCTWIIPSIINIIRYNWSRLLKNRFSQFCLLSEIREFRYISTQSATFPAFQLCHCGVKTGVSWFHHQIPTGFSLEDECVLVNENHTSFIDWIQGIRIIPSLKCMQIRVSIALFTGLSGECIVIVMHATMWLCVKYDDKTAFWVILNNWHLNKFVTMNFWKFLSFLSYSA